MTWTPILWLLAFLPALVALYFLKLRRRDVVVASTLLWRRAIEDLHVNAPFQKLRKSWLLLLQLLVLAGLILALWRPRIGGTHEVERSLLLLIDNSASMSARESGGSRLDLAKNAALDLVRGFEKGDQAAVLTFSSRTATIEPVTDDKTVLEARIRAIEPTALPTDVGQALLVAASLADSLPQAEIRVIGDGTYGDLSGLPAELKQRAIKFTSTATPLDNAGITEIDVRKSFEAERTTSVFALVESFGAAPVRLTVTLAVDGAVRDAREVELAPGGSAPVLFDVTAVESGIASVSIHAKDALAIDDEAWVRIDPPRALSVLAVGEPNAWVDLVLEASSGLRKRRMSSAEYAKALEAGGEGGAGRQLEADVIIFDREAPAASPPLPALYVGCVPSLPEPLAGAPVKKTPLIVDWDRSHPVNRFLIYTDLYIEESRVFPDAADYKSLLEAEVGSILGTYQFRSPGRLPVPAILVGFDILKSNWPIGHYSFPIFFANAIAWLGAGPTGERPARNRTGETLVHHSRDKSGADAETRFRSPSGREILAVREANGAVATNATTEAGVYELDLGGGSTLQYPVALLDRNESRLTPSKAVEMGDFSVPVTGAAEESTRDLWMWFALAALAFVLLEWYVYNRRLA
jgi:VWA domain-containing protein/aerotolerance regulator-like protein